MASLKYWLWLANLKGVSGQTRLALLRRFGDPEAVYYADADEILLTETITAKESISSLVAIILVVMGSLALLSGTDQFLTKFIYHQNIIQMPTLTIL